MSGTVRVPDVYFNGATATAHIPVTYEYGLPVNFTRMSSFCADRVFIQHERSNLPVNSINKIDRSCDAYLTSELTSL